MNHAKASFFFVILAALSLVKAAAQTASDLPAPMDVWPTGKMPGATATLPEKGSAASGFTNVSVPQLMVFPATSARPAPCIVVCPGGGYKHLAYGKEGVEIARWLNTLGITAIVLKYRVPANRDGAQQDLERSLRLVRSHAADWKINAHQVGLMGFSAGGHLSARVSGSGETAAYAPLDAVDQLSFRPDFTVLVYPGLFGEGRPVIA